VNMTNVMTIKTLFPQIQECATIPDQRRSLSRCTASGMRT
jgi:hypothetical protein